VQLLQRKYGIIIRRLSLQEAALQGPKSAFIAATVALIVAAILASCIYRVTI